MVHDSITILKKGERTVGVLLRFSFFLFVFIPIDINCRRVVPVNICRHYFHCSPRCHYVVMVCVSYEEHDSALSFDSGLIR